MEVRPKYPSFLPVFLRPGWGLSKKINKIVTQLLPNKLTQQFDNLAGSTNHQECSTLFYLVYINAKNPGRIVEIGSFKGKSTCWMAKALQIAKSNEKFVAIDPHIEASFEEFSSNISNCGLIQNVDVVKKISEDAIKGWNQPIKLLFVDGSHRYDDVMLDLKLWEPFVKSGSTLVMHDTEPTGSRVEVRKAMYDYVIRSKRFKILLQLKNMTCFTKK